MMKYLQKLGKALMLPVACLPICGILMGIGYALCPSTMQGGDVTGILEMIGFFLVKAGGALIDNMAILFVIGVGVGMADDNDGTAALAARAGVPALAPAGLGLGKRISRWPTWAGTIPAAHAAPAGTGAALSAPLGNYPHRYDGCCGQRLLLPRQTAGRLSLRSSRC